jgi:hypothetical protein
MTLMTKAGVMTVNWIKIARFLVEQYPEGNHTQSLTREMIMGEQVLEYKSICKLPFGAYAQVHNDIQVTNTIEPRTGAINFPPHNMHGGHRFINLVTDDIILFLEGNGWSYPCPLK